MAKLKNLFITSDAKYLSLEIELGENESIESVILTDYTDYNISNQEEQGYDITEYLIVQGNKVTLNLNANYLGLEIYESLYIVDIEVTKTISEDNVVNIYHTEVIGNITKIYSCLVESVEDLDECIIGNKVDVDKIDLATKNFLDFEIFKLALENKNFDEAFKLFSLLSERCDCKSCNSIYDLKPILGFNFLNNVDIEMKNNINTIETIVEVEVPVEKEIVYIPQTEDDIFD